MMWMLRAIAATATACALALAGFVAASPARASCVLPPRVSAHSFTGTVTDVKNAGRTARVLTDAGGMVTVNGSPSDAGPNTATSVDRTYRPGVRYEFHPLNPASPYQDNACTATRAISAGTGANRTTSHTPPVAAGLTTDTRWPIALWTAAGTVVLLAGGGILLIHRRRRSP